MKKAVKSAMYLRMMGIVYFAQALVMVVFGIVVLLQAPALDKQLANTIEYPLLALVLGGLAGSLFIPKMMIQKIDGSLELKQKVPKYFKAVLIRSAFLELPALFAGVAAFLTGNLYFLAVIPLFLLVFLAYRPSKASIARDLNLSGPERAMLDDPEAIIAEVESNQGG